MDSVRELLYEFPLDLFTVSDTWLSSHILDEEFKIDGYSFVRKDKMNTEKPRGGGLIVYVRDGINFSERDDISNGRIEDIWIEVKRDKCKNLLVGSFYRPPDQNLDYFNTSISESLESLHDNDLSGDVVLLGDFDVDFLKHSNFMRSLCEVFENNDLHQIIRQPTRITINSRTLIDLIWERLFCEVADEHAPVKKRRVKGFKSPWVNDELTSLRKARDYHHKKAIKTNLSSHWIRDKKLRNQVTRYEKKLKSNYYFNLINDSMSNSEEMWKSLKQVLPGSKDRKQITSISITGKVYKKCEEITEALLINIFRLSVKSWEGALVVSHVKVMFFHSKLYGFRRKRSTASALLEFTDEILDNMDQGKVTGAAFLDLKKAFDTVNHRILLLKLQSLGVDVLSILWFKSYFENRGCQTSVGDSISSKRTMNIGVPQGSVLGPLLFLVYVNDLADVLKNCQASLFADDTAIYCSSQIAIDLEAKLDEDLNHVKDWLNKHRLTLNIKKSKLMLIGGQKRLKLLGQVNLNINDENIERTGHYKYLGVVINENLIWSDHVDLICSKVSKRLGMIKRFIGGPTGIVRPDLWVRSDRERSQHLRNGQPPSIFS
ncbi:putative RNA-directed DNA polymerase from transposon BS [Stylophora pistillata]|uniref:Putative RNA-directed DNA polymerase from transposon BS n=1 Tax=Stylophora pistillata TaxID=50429 RepID=A0A2B4RJ86_STYPI|nr:putative RNA-directed DNA polymerase from transposon BS [Stylophora pistillata]